MIKNININIDEYRYDLPKDRIALYPHNYRDGSKLLVVKENSIYDSFFNEIPRHLPQNSLLIFNITKVIRARILFKKETGAVIELLLLNPVEPSENIEITFGSASPAIWNCLIGNAKKWKSGDLSLQFDCEGIKTELTASLIKKGSEVSQVKFSWEPDQIPLASIFEAIGHIPLPPYISREDEPVDAVRYQTVYAKNDGSVAAPTAGLHFTDEILKELSEKGIDQSNITLHIGAGTFKPVIHKKIIEHVMHSEEIVADTILMQKIIEHDGIVIPVGTTSVRSVESLYWHGLRSILTNEPLTEDFSVDQWEPYNYKRSDLLPAKEVFSYLLKKMRSKGIERLKGETKLIIVPGYEFAVTNGLITNFHQSKSTLLLLVAALIGDTWGKAYRHALENNYRFLSYGDACLFLKSGKC